MPVCNRTVLFSITASFVLFYLLSTVLSTHHQDEFPIPIHSEGKLKTRTHQYEKIYQKVVRDRHSLIKKFGPEPVDIELFPPNVSPWPPYTVWDFFPAAFNCPHEVERIGALGDGGKWVCGLSRVATKPNCVVYSIGINHESSFEAEILDRTTGCHIWGYDFSVSRFGPEISWFSSFRTTFKPYGLSGVDAHGPNDKPKMYTLATLMEMNGHKFIDILKVDIESYEFDTLTSLIKPYISSGKPLPFGQLQLEIHIWHKRFPEYLAWFEMLEHAGLRPFWTEPNLVYVNYARDRGAELAEYSFLNIKGGNAFVPHIEFEPEPEVPVAESEKEGVEEEKRAE